MARSRPTRPARGGKRKGSRGLSLALGAVTLAVGALGLSALVGHLGTPGAGTRRPPRADPESLRAILNPKGVRVEVLNGSGQAGAGSRVASLLSEGGFEVVGVRNADRFDYPRTLVVARAADLRKARAVARRISGSQLIRQRAPLDWDVTVVVGRDRARAP